jgi:hypothetical protein
MLSRRGNIKGTLGTIDDYLLAHRFKSALGFTESPIGFPTRDRLGEHYKGRL